MLNWVLQSRGITYLRYLRRRVVPRLVPGTFLQELLKNPGNVGAVCASSRQLARYIANQVPCGDGIVVELGAGTGAVTRALLESGISPARLIVVEYSAAFVQTLRARFPGLTIIHGNAVDLAHLLPQGVAVDAIVSSLPLCSLPKTVTHSIVQQWDLMLKPRGGVAVQFTYNFRKPHWLARAATHHGRVGTVWANFPPARVFTLRYAASHDPTSQPTLPNPD